MSVIIVVEPHARRANLAVARSHDQLDMRKRFRGLDPGTMKAKAAQEERVDVR